MSLATLRLYQCVSEPLTDYRGRDEPPEDYRVAELVIARSHGQARLMASIHGDCEPIPDMPRFSVRILACPVPDSETQPRIVTGDWPYDLYWDRFSAPRDGDPSVEPICRDCDGRAMVGDPKDCRRCGSTGVELPPDVLDKWSAVDVQVATHD